jgi:hypothetical protein
MKPVAVALIALCVGSVVAVAAPRNAKPEPAFEEPHGADLNQGKPPSEIFKSDCSVCHKSPQGLAKSSGPGLQGFLRQHYTTGTSQASAMAGYLASVGGSAAAKPTSPERPDKPEKPERPERASPPERPQPAVARRPAANEPANDGLTPPHSGKPEKPAEAKPESKPAETATAPATERPGRRGRKPEQPKIEEAKPVVEPEKPASPPEPSTRTAEPAPPEPKPAAAPVPEIPL